MWHYWCRFNPTALTVCVFFHSCLFGTFLWNCERHRMAEVSVKYASEQHTTYSMQVTVPSCMHIVTYIILAFYDLEYILCCVLQGLKEKTVSLWSFTNSQVYTVYNTCNHMHTCVLMSKSGIAIWWDIYIHSFWYIQPIMIPLCS